MNVRSILVGGLLWPAQQQRLFVLLINHVATSIMILALCIQQVVTGQLLMKSRKLCACSFPVNIHTRNNNVSVLFYFTLAVVRHVSLYVSRLRQFL